MEAGNCPTLNMNAMQNYLLSQPLTVPHDRPSFSQTASWIIHVVISNGSLSELHVKIEGFPPCTTEWHAKQVGIQHSTLPWVWEVKEMPSS